MELQADRFAAFLMRKDELPCFTVICGEELQLNLDALALYRARAAELGIQSREIFFLQHPPDEGIVAALQHVSLFGEKKLVELHYQEETLRAPLARFLLDLIDIAAEGATPLLMFAHNIKDVKKQKWYQLALQKHCVLRSYRLSHEAFEKELIKRLKHAELTLTHNAFELLLESCRGNLLAAQQLIEKLKIYEETPLNAKVLRQEFIDAARVQLDELSDAILLRRWQEALRITRVVQEQSSEGDMPLLIWLLQRDMRVLYRMLCASNAQWSTIFQEERVFRQKQDVFRRATGLFDVREAGTCLEWCAQLDAVNKGAVRGDVFQVLNQYLYHHALMRKE